MQTARPLQALLACLQNWLAGWLPSRLHFNPPPIKILYIGMLFWYGADAYIACLPPIIMTNP